MSSKMPKDFLWGGAIAAHQAEGAWNVAGRGMSIADVMTAGGNGIPREITRGIKEDVYIDLLEPYFSNRPRGRAQ